MRAIEFLDKLAAFEQAVFTAGDAVKILNKPAPYARLFLHRLGKQGLVKRVERNKYAVREAGDFAIASNLVFPSYISLWMAFRLHHLTTQLPNVIQVVTSKQKTPVKLFEGYNAEFIKLSPRRVFGYTREKWGVGWMYLAEKEKAVIDSLYLFHGPDLDDIRKALRDCELKKLEEYALRMDSKVLLRRLGYLLDKENLPVPGSFSKVAFGRAIPLHPLYPTDGKVDKNWQVIQNYRFDQYDFKS